MAKKRMYPVSDLKELKRVTSGKLGKFPLYGLLLYSAFDTDFAEFVMKNGGTLDHMTGDQCLLIAFENPAPWGEKFQKRWQEVLGDEYPAVAEKWKGILPEDRDLGFEVAEKLGIMKNCLPCIALMDDLLSNRILCIPIIANKEKYPLYFKDISTIIQKTLELDEEDTLEGVRAKWRLLWVKWILPEKIKGFNAALQEWGSLFTDTKDKLISIIDLVSPVLKQVIPGKGS